MTGLHPTLRRVVAGVALLAPAVAVLVLLLLEGRGAPLTTGSALSAAAAGALAAGVLGLGATELLLRRHRIGLAQLDGQIEALGQGTPLPPRTQVGLPEVDRPVRRLAERAVEVGKRQAAAQEAARETSHQLRTPLTALLLRLEEISAADDLTAVRAEAEVAIAQVERLTGVVDTYLARTRGEVTELPEISLDSVLAGLQREYQPAFTAAHRSMRIEGQRGLLVRAAPADLAQVMQTLVENALHHGAGTVTVEARRSGASVVVEVTDAGEGIPPAIAPHVFERAVTSRGTGLGLGLARQLIQRNGGRLELVRSRPAVFAVFLQAPRSR